MRPALASASGLRPASAFVVISAVLVAVAVRVAMAAELPPRESRGPERVERAPDAAYALEDRHGRTLAEFHTRFDLLMSPRATWRAHTPERLAAALAEAIGRGASPSELLQRMFPGMAAGAIRARTALSTAQAERVRAWTQRERVHGLRVVPSRSPERYEILWEPLIALSEAARSEHGVRSAMSWTRRLLDGLLECLFPESWERLRADAKVLERSRDLVWNDLVPSGHARVHAGLDPGAALAVDACLRREGVNPLQMRVDTARTRVYPEGQPEILGDWGFAPTALAPEPRTGLELLSLHLLELPGSEWIERVPGTYRFARNKASRREIRPYFLERVDRSPAPRVRTTLDAELMRATHAELERALEQFGAALAMAIVLELESGEVLAADAVARYPVGAFAPIYHRFTPGSTFKVLTMAVALEAGAVSPRTEFEVGDGEQYALRVGSTVRAIHEAENTQAHGRIRAEQCLAYSSNAGMAQIALTVADVFFRGKLRALGYGERPGSGLGVESGGWLAPLPWKRAHTQASIGFGHELATTLWQHAAGLAAVVRGGEWKPLSLFRAVSQERRSRAAAPGASRRVFREDTCADVRAMMVLGAREGTGRSVCGERDDLFVGTKTGTAQKVPGEICMHAWGQTVERAARAGRGPTAGEMAALRAAGPTGHKRCYTSSMCLFGRRADGGPEVFVLVVLEEPIGTVRFGSQTAGPVAVAILDEALGLAHRGERATRLELSAFAPSDLDLSVAALQPWREAVAR